MYNDDTFNGRYVMLVLHNNNAEAVAPEFEKRDITDFVGLTATFTTEAFSANVEASDIVLILPYDIAAKVGCLGILTASSATVPADVTRRAADANNYHRGCSLVPLSGVCRFQARRIVASTMAGGVFTLDPNTPFTAAPGLVPYVVINDQDQMAPVADAANAYTPADTVGNKADTAVLAISVVASLMAYAKGNITLATWIHNLVNAIQTLTETGGTITSTAAELDIYRVETPMGIFKPIALKLDTTNMGAADEIIIRVYERIIAGGLLHLSDEVPFVGVQAIPIKTISLDPNRFGIQVTIDETAGAHVAYDWAVTFES
jgi:hypothetical protein